MGLWATRHWRFGLRHVRANSGTGPQFSLLRRSPREPWAWVPDFPGEESVGLLLQTIDELRLAIGQPGISGGTQFAPRDRSRSAVR